MIHHDTSGAVVGADHVLRFFRDNQCDAGECGEDSGGAVDRIRIWDKPLATANILAMETCGDVNSDGTINASDALAALKAAVGSAFCSLARCDVTRNGTVQTSDALRILRIAVGSATAPSTCVIL